MNSVDIKNKIELLFTQTDITIDDLDEFVHYNKYKYSNLPEDYFKDKKIKDALMIMTNYKDCNDEKFKRRLAFIEDNIDNNELILKVLKDELTENYLDKLMLQNEII